MQEGQVIKPVEASDNPTQTANDWKFKSEDDQNNQPTQTSSPIDDVSWTASEFIAHQKSAGWYIKLFLLAMGGGVAVYFLTKDYVSTSMIGIIAIIFGIIAARKPRELQYQINSSGIYIGEKFYPFSNFKSFAIIQEGGVESIWFSPMKRLMPNLSIYFAPEDSQKIVNAISQVLPIEDKGLDAVDKLMHKVRF